MIKMFFSDISNPELQYFHGLTVPNFSISLSEIIDDNTGLFQVENMPNGLYRIYPLFYCETITSSNESDKVLENKCIITSETTSETYFNFLSDNGEVFSFNFIRNFYSIGDSLTDEEFNALVTLYRHNNSFTDTININNSNISGAYADYRFDLESTTIVDNGVLITQETLSNIGTVRLLNPVFANSSYVLSLKVYSIEDVVVGFDGVSNVEVTTLNVPLVENTDVNIPFETLELNNVVGFDATVSITHDKGVIGFTNHLTLTAPVTGTVLSPVSLSVVLDNSGTPVSGETVTFYDDSTSIGTGVTDSDGVATLNYTPSTGKEYKFKVKYGDVVSNTVSCVVSKRTGSLSLSSNKASVLLDESFTVTGTLLVGGNALNNATVKLYDDETLIDTLTTNSNGVFTKTITPTVSGNYNLQAIYEGNVSDNGVSSSFVNVTVLEPVLTLGVTGTSLTSYNSSPFTYEDTVMIDYGDGTVETYSGGQLNHTYDTSGSHTVNVYGDVTALNDNCFRGETNITSAIIGDTVTSLGNGCFYGGIGFTSISLPDTVTSIGIACFYNCTGLTSISLGSSVTSLGIACFYNCTGLTSLTIPASVSSIGTGCFNGATNLTTLYLYWTDSDIITYANSSSSDWLYNSSVNSFSIPNGTTSQYTAKSYPSNMLTER